MFKKSGPSVLGSGGEWLLHSLYGGHKPQLAPCEQLQTCLTVKEMKNTLFDTRHWENLPAALCSPSLRLVAILSQTRWAAIEHPVLKHILPNLPVIFRCPSQCEPLARPMRHAQSHPDAYLRVMLAVRTLAQVQRSAARYHNWLMRRGYAVVHPACTTPSFQGRRAGDLFISAQCPTHIALLRHDIRR